jgi:hypothetical protein
MPNISASFGFLDISVDTTLHDVAQDISFGRRLPRAEDPRRFCGIPLTVAVKAARGEAEISPSVK